MDFQKKENGNFVQIIIFINLDLITSGTNGEWEELSTPILVINNLVYLGLFDPFWTHILACRVSEDIIPLTIAKDEE